MQSSLPVARTPKSQALKHHAGFTAVELLAVLGTIGCLALVLGLNLAGTRPDLVAVQCRNNLRQLTAAWTMYANDHGGKLVYNRDGAMNGLSHGSEAWVAGWLDFASRSDNTNTAMLIDHLSYPFAACLGPYLKSSTVFKCPADSTTVRIGGQILPRVRSYSMNNYLGFSSRTWLSPARYKVCTSTSQVISPDRMFVFIDEREDSINDGWFASDPDTRWQLIDLPANRHHGSAGISFVDGHAEIHHWKDPRTSPALSPGQLLPLNVNLPNDLDILWLQGSAVGRVIQ